VLSPWRFVVWFGIVALFGDILYEGARSITGPLLASLGASALVVGVVTGVGETAALLLRLVSGPLADRSGNFWAWTVAGYALTVISVPTLGLTSALWVACALVILERVGKAMRAPAKDTLLSHATSVTGRGKGFAVHEVLDQFGALLGPLLVAGMLLATCWSSPCPALPSWCWSCSSAGGCRIPAPRTSRTPGPLPGHGSNVCRCHGPSGSSPSSPPSR
jgi:sugar phosphate permease